MRGKKPSPAMIVACLALLVALGGTAVAAGRYVITSTSQIKPSVLRELRGSAVASAASLAAKGSHDVVAKVRSTGAFTTTTGVETNVALTGATWTQRAEELDLIAGQLTLDVPSEAECPKGNGAVVRVFLDGKDSADWYVVAFGAAKTESRSWAPWDIHSLFEPGTNTTHTITVKADDTCTNGGHFTVQSIAVDVVGAR